MNYLTVFTNVFTVANMETKDKQFHMRLTPRYSNALDALAKREGVSKSNYLRNHIRSEAKKKGIPT